VASRKCGKLAHCRHSQDFLRKSSASSAISANSTKDRLDRRPGHVVNLVDDLVACSQFQKKNLQGLFFQHSHIALSIHFSWQVEYGRNESGNLVNLFGIDCIAQATLKLQCSRATVSSAFLQFQISQNEKHPISSGNLIELQEVIAHLHVVQTLGCRKKAELQRLLFASIKKIKSQERDLAQSLYWSRLHFIGRKHLHVRDFAKGWTFCATIFHFPEPLEKVGSAGMCSISFPIYITTGLRKSNQVTWGQSSWIKQSYTLGAALFACHFLLLFWYCFSCLCFGAPGLGEEAKTENGAHTMKPLPSSFSFDHSPKGS